LKEKIVTLNDISVSFDGQQVLRNFDLDVFEGDFISIIGKSGVGKSTVLNLILGDLTQDSGEIYFNKNHEVKKTIVFQEYNKSLFPWYNVTENLKILFDGNVSERDIDFYLTLVGLEKHKQKFPWQLSGGMQQRLAIARALMLKPNLLLLDEPFGSLDYSLRDDLEDVLYSIYAKMNLTVVNVTHDIESALFMSNRVCFISEEGNIQKNLNIRHEDYADKFLLRTSVAYKELHNLINQ